MEIILKSFSYFILKIDLISSGFRKGHLLFLRIIFKDNVSIFLGTLSKYFILILSGKRKEIV